MKYFEKIDGLRFVAILAVLVHHIASVFSTYIDWGYFGVDLFFVISGFLITTILLKTKGTFKKDYINFLARRSLRIFPLYYFVLLLLLVLGHPAVRDNSLYLLTYTFNYVFPFIHEKNPIEHFWSLCVEEQFYLFWPFIVLGFKRYSKLLLGVVIAMVIFAYTQIYFNIVPSIKIYNYAGLLTRMGSLGLGALGAIMFMRADLIVLKILHHKTIEYVMYVVLITSLVLFQPLLMGLCSLFFVLKAANNSYRSLWVSSFLAHRFVLYVGRISYGLYIYHVPILFYMTPYVFDPIWNQIDFEAFGRLGILKYHSWIIKFPLYMGLTILVSELSYKYFEKPLLTLKDKFFKYA